MMRLMFRLRPMPIASVATRNFTLPSRSLNYCACNFFVSGGRAPYIMLQKLLSRSSSIFGSYFYSFCFFHSSYSLLSFSTSFRCFSFPFQLFVFLLFESSSAVFSSLNVVIDAKLFIADLMAKSLARLKATMQSPTLKSFNELMLVFST